MYICIFNLDGYSIDMTIEEIIDDKCIKMIKIITKNNQKNINKTNNDHREISTNRNKKELEIIEFVKEKYKIAEI